MAKIEVLHLTPTERGELHSYLRKHNLPASVAQRIRIVLLLDEGVSYREITEKLGTPASTISRWKQRYDADGLLGLATIHPGLPPQKLTPQLRARAGQDAASAARWLHAPVLAQDGGAHEGQQESYRADLEGSGTEATPAGSLHGERRSAV